MPPLPRCWISVVDQSGQQHLNTRLDPAAALPRTDNHDWLNHVFGAKDIYITGAVTGPVVKQPFVAISYRVQCTAGPVVLTLSIAPETLSRLLQEQDLPQGWIGVIADSEGMILGRTQGPELIGQPMTLRLTGQSGLECGYARTDTCLHRLDNIRAYPLGDWRFRTSGCDRWQNTGSRPVYRHRCFCRFGSDGGVGCTTYAQGYSPAHPAG